MILSAVNICYDPSHQPFASEGAVKIQNLNSQRPASKIIRAVLRDSDINPEEAVNYSIHRCYCRCNTHAEHQSHEAFKSESTLDQLEIREGDSIFIRKIDDRGEEKVEEMAEEQGSTLIRRSSRKRKERTADQSLQSQSQKTSEKAAPTSRKRRSTSNPSKAPAAVDKVSSNLANLSSKAAATARSISKLLGGDDWKTQSIRKLGPIQTRGNRQLQSLVRLVKTSLQIPQLSNFDRNGLFNSDLVEALARAHHQRISNPRKHGDEMFTNTFGISDYEKANELLKGKIEEDGSWERSSISHLDESALSNLVSRFPLGDSGLSDYGLNAARAICSYWNNETWINQAPLPGLSPISLKGAGACVTLREIAELTRIKPGEATPSGYPPIVLKALSDSIKKNKEAFDSNKGASQGGWSQKRNLKDALALLKKRVAVTRATLSSTAGPSSEASGSRIDGERQVRRRLDGGK